MVIRTGETDRFPLEGTWFFTVNFQKGEIEHRNFTDSQSAKRELIALIEHYTNANIPFKLYGVWQGRWRTDVFDLDPKLMVQRFSA